MTNISLVEALTICEQLQMENRRKWFTYQAWWCWGCVTFTKGDRTKFCFANAPGNRGCEQVNKHFDISHPS